MSKEREDTEVSEIVWVTAQDLYRFLNYQNFWREIIQVANNVQYSPMVRESEDWKQILEIRQSLPISSNSKTSEHLMLLMRKIQAVRTCPYFSE